MIELALLLFAKGTLILAVAALCQAVAGDRISAASRHLIWTASVVALLALPVVTPVLPGWSLPAGTARLWDASADPATAAEGGATAAPTAAGAAVPAAPTPIEATEPAGESGAGAARRSALPVALLVVYLAGVSLVLSRIAVERVTVRRLERRSRDNGDARWDALLDESRRALGMSRRVRLLRIAEPLGPVTWGTLSPTILIPDSADEWSTERRRAVLLHELAHVDRWDCLTQTLALLASALYWPHPGIWWAARRLRVERELACDDRVLAAGTRPHDYAGHLLEIARASRRMPASVAALSLSRPSLLEGRMRAILDDARTRVAPGRRTVAVAAAVAAALVVTLAGADVARSQGTPVLVEELRIGGPEPDYRFENVQYMAVGEDDAIFVADQPARAMTRIRMYDGNGRFVRNVGGPGEGRGQYRYVNGMVITPTGELAIYDVFNQRISLFDARGSFLRSMPSRVGGNWTGRDFYVDRDGNFYVFAVRSTREIPVNPAGAPPVRDPPPPNNRYYLKLSPRGEILDTLDQPISNVRPRPGFVIMAPEGYLQPFPNELVLDLGPEGRFVSGYTSEYALDIETARGEVRRIERSYTPIPIAGQERAQWQARADFYTQRDARSASSGVTIPAVKPAYRDIDVAEDGRIWVHRYAPATERPITLPRPVDAPPALTWRDVPTFDVFEPDGRFLWTVVAPENTRLSVREGDRVWGIHTTPTGEIQVVRYRLN